MSPFKCPECGSEVADGLIEMRYELDGARVTIKNVPAKICPQCGEEFIEGYVAENVNRLVDRVVEDVASYVKRLPASPSPKVHEIVIAA